MLLYSPSIAIAKIEEPTFDSIERSSDRLVLLLMLRLLRPLELLLLLLLLLVMMLLLLMLLMGSSFWRKLQQHREKDQQ